MSNNNSSCEDISPNIHQDSILALEALLDIKRSPSLRPTKPGISNASQIPLLKPKTSNDETPKHKSKGITTKIPKQSGVRTNQMCLPSDLKTQNQVNMRIGAKELINNGQKKSPEFFLTDTRRKVTPNVVPQLNLRPNALEISKNWIQTENTQEKGPSLSMKKSHPRVGHNSNNGITFLSEKIPYFKKIPYDQIIQRSLETKPSQSAPETNWVQNDGKIRTSVESQELTSIEIPITGLVPNPLNPKPEQVSSSNISNSKKNHSLALLKTKEEKTTEKVPIIRATEVEAALRSKPQRGRKRENLTVLERLELTRTRNREHAKSTR